ncbi:MAG: hypothetical protein OEX07_03870 [Gammaproteobacteria bacterium]|nr:hypothetical protein [Gammaproteobacteria bacterium]
MKKHVYSRAVNKQEGQLAVNLAEILVSAGLVVGAAFQAQVFFQDYQFESYYDELKSVETALWDYKGVTGRWPGDCDADGVIDIGMDNKVSSKSEKAQCAFSVDSDEAIMSVLTDLASANMLDDDLRDKFAGNDGSRMQVSHDALHEAHVQNVIVAFDVPVDLARWLDDKIDGEEAVNQGRIRLWANEKVQEWPSSKETIEVNIAYYFDSKI